MLIVFIEPCTFGQAVNSNILISLPLHLDKYWGGGGGSSPSSPHPQPPLGQEYGGLGFGKSFKFKIL